MSHRTCDQTATSFLEVHFWLILTLTTSNRMHFRFSYIVRSTVHAGKFWIHCRIYYPLLIWLKKTKIQTNQKIPKFNFIERFLWPFLPKVWYIAKYLLWLDFISLRFLLQFLQQKRSERPWFEVATSGLGSSFSLVEFGWKMKLNRFEGLRVHWSVLWVLKLKMKNP